MTLRLEMLNNQGVWVQVSSFSFGVVPVGEFRQIASSFTPNQLLALLGFYGSHVVRGVVTLSNSVGSVDLLTNGVPFTLAELQIGLVPSITSFQVFADKTVAVNVQESPGSNFYELRVKRLFSDAVFMEAGQCFQGICYIAGSIEHPEFAASSGVLIGANWSGTGILDGHGLRRVGGNVELISFDSGTYYVELYENNSLRTRKKLVVP